MSKIYSRKEDWKVHVVSWCPDMDAGVWEQTANMAKLPFVFHHVALMPDAHKGYGMPIGGVMATKGVVVPNAVGVDIGCGMSAVRTNLTELTHKNLTDIMGIIRETIPVGRSRRHETQPDDQQHKELQAEDLMPELYTNYHTIPNKEMANARRQMGTLGGGNHFIEIQKGSDGHIYLMVHSGSRNVGHKTATHYNKLAKMLNEKWYSGVPPDNGLAFLPIESVIGTNYLRDMEYCVQYAARNRRLMLIRMLEAIGKVKKTIYPIEKYIAASINIAHNYADMENHFGQNVMVHRKGATQAREGQVGIIPGSQGSFSYITEGLGHPNSFNSSSHGAGRLMSRRRAKEELDLELEVKHLDDLGVVHSVRSVNELDEAAGAYKDIKEVMANQDDLTKPVVGLRPLAVIKG